MFAASCPWARCACREDLKFVKQKLKKLEEKAGKDEAKAGEMECEVAALQEDVPRLQARAEELAVQLKKAEEVRTRLAAGRLALQLHQPRGVAWHDSKGAWRTHAVLGLNLPHAGALCQGCWNVHRDIVVIIWWPGVCAGAGGPVRGH